MLALKSDEEFSKFLNGANFAFTGRMPSSHIDQSTNGKKKKGLDEDDESEDEDFNMDDENLDQDNWYYKIESN